MSSAVCSPLVNDVSILVEYCEFSTFNCIASQCISLRHLHLCIKHVDFLVNFFVCDSECDFFCSYISFRSCLFEKSVSLAFLKSTYIMFLITRYPCINSISIFILDSKSSTRNFLSTGDICLSDRNLLIKHAYFLVHLILRYSEFDRFSLYITVWCSLFDKSILLTFFKSAYIVFFLSRSPCVNSLTCFILDSHLGTFDFLSTSDFCLCDSDLLIFHHKLLVLITSCEFDRFSFYISLRGCSFCKSIFLTFFKTADTVFFFSRSPFINSLAFFICDSHLGTFDFLSTSDFCL